MATPSEIHKKLSDKFGDRIVELQDDETGRTDPTVQVSPEGLDEVCEFLRTQSGLEFDSLACLSGVEYDENLGVVYHLHSYTKNHRITLKVLLPGGPSPSPEQAVPSVTGVWAGADWFEREIWDLYGIDFKGHPDCYGPDREGYTPANTGQVRRLMMPHDWVGHPLRKDYEEQADYHGIPTTRRDPLHPEAEDQA